MTDTQTRPTIRNAGTTPRTRHKLFLNIPVTDLQRAIGFYEALGFAFNVQFTDPTSTCMLVGEDAYVMLLTRERLGSFVDVPVGDPRKTATAIWSISVDSRDAVDAMVRAAQAAGGAPTMEPEDHGFMYSWSFRDPDGNGWGVFWMDPSFVQG